MGDLLKEGLLCTRDDHLYAHRFTAKMESRFTHGICPKLSGQTSIHKNSNILTDQKNILVVDDRHANLILMGVLLDSLGFEVQTARTALETFTLLQKEPIDLILMDFQLELETGPDIATALNELLGDDAPPVIGISANDRRAIEGELQKAKMVDYIERPCSASQLYKTLWAHL